MALGIGEAGLEIEAAGLRVVASVLPQRVDRHDPTQGIARQVDTAIDGTVLVTEWPADATDQRIEITLELLTEAEAATLMAMLRTPGPVALKLDPAASTSIACMLGQSDEQTIEHRVGPYPETAPATIRDLWRAQLTLYRLG